GRIIFLRFFPAIPSSATFQSVTTMLRKLPGKASLLLVVNGAEKIAWNADEPLAVGSAFKLATLAALLADVETGKRTWAEAVELTRQLKSPFGGILSEWPERSPITIHSLAALMIAQSDNTAADVLLNIVGRASIERRAPHTRPFPSTREV